MSDYNLAGVSPISKKAGAAITQYCAVMQDGTTEGSVVITDATTAKCVGFAMKGATAAGQMVPIQRSGEAKAIASAAIAVGATVMCNAAGKVTTIAANSGLNVGVGQAVSAAGADGDIITISVMLSAPGPVSA